LGSYTRELTFSLDQFSGGRSLKAFTDAGWDSGGRIVGGYSVSQIGGNQNDVFRGTGVRCGYTDTKEGMQAKEALDKLGIRCGQESLYLVPPFGGSKTPPKLQLAIGRR
jgi:hypothetical protein